ncbi:beta-ketoacyl synthase N-terminal-like domain-containing protein [Amycolatopsis halotolerans]|uniref:Beta-ketoacyl synthase N-terminal-like domain-containing protein n=1 Tax=Amycolatopsis halotolerans TaxID=330083 RepID=A0ABV7QHE2_9PSEU
MNTDDIEILGVGMHPFGRYTNSSLKDLNRVACVSALVDAGLAVRDIDAVYAANAMAGLLQGQEMIRGQSVMREIGIERVPVTNVENACASGSTALRQAILAIRAGSADTVLVAGVEKMFVEDRSRTLAALESAGDLDVVSGIGLQFTAVYGMRLRKLIAAGRLTVDDLVAVSVKSHANGERNPYAQHRKVVSPEEVLGSRPIADPLTLLMCSSICDGAAAVVVARCGAIPTRKPTVRIRASQAATGYTTTGNEPSLTELCAAAAYAEAGFGPEDVDVAEVHDAMAPAELIAYEQLGFCNPGDAGALLDSGTTQIDGCRPVNPSGGLSSRGHAVGATGLAQIAELIWQLRGEATGRQTQRPRIGLAHNNGGWLEGESAVSCVHLLERTDPWD